MEKKQLHTQIQVSLSIRHKTHIDASVKEYSVLLSAERLARNQQPPTQKPSTARLRITPQASGGRKKYPGMRYFYSGTFQRESLYSAIF